MSEPGISVHQDALADLESALTAAGDAITDAVTTAMRDVDLRVHLWATGTQSRAAEIAYEGRLRAGVERLTAALDQVRVAVADVREEARRIEVQNVALLES
ncbi:hypothetical protein [Cellulomonas soli]|uniref:hypothetical protein n=1 Tax=Cellulomonas soli TaxID=931535 RepID=UPI0011BDF050|nr:hypothetical protein [Cellulomonas soli]NYI59400.1 hypothetical protein [Cellulomonas soli]